MLKSVKILELLLQKKLNKMAGSFAFLLPEGGLSHLDCAGGAFEDKEANEALFSSIEALTEQSSNRRVLRIPHHINSPEFTQAILVAFRQIEEKLDERELHYGGK